MKGLGFKTERQEKCSLSSSENHLSGCGVRFAHDISDPHRSREGKRRPVITVKQFQRLLGLMAAASNVIPIGLLYMSPLQWWLKTKGFSPRGNLLRMIKVTMDASDGRIPYQLGSGRELSPCPRSVERSSPRLAHQRTGDAGRVSGSKTLSPRPKRPPCVGAHRQHSSGLLYQPPRRSMVPSPVQAIAPDPCVVPGQSPLTDRSLHPWASHCGSRHPVETGAMARGMDASQRGCEADLESVWPGTG